MSIVPIVDSLWRGTWPLVVRTRIPHAAKEEEKDPQYQTGLIPLVCNMNPPLCMLLLSSYTAALSTSVRTAHHRFRPQSDSLRCLVSYHWGRSRSTRSARSNRSARAFGALGEGIVGALVPRLPRGRVRSIPRVASSFSTLAHLVSGNNVVRLKCIWSFSLWSRPDVAYRKQLS